MESTVESTVKSTMKMVMDSIHPVLFVNPDPFHHLLQVLNRQLIQKLMISSMNIIWTFQNTIATIIFSNRITTITSYAMRPNIYAYRNTSSTIPPNGIRIIFTGNNKKSGQKAQGTGLLSLAVLQVVQVMQVSYNEDLAESSSSSAAALAPEP